MNKPKSHFLRPVLVFTALGSMVLIHLLSWMSSTPAFLQLIVNSLACVYVGCMSSSKIRVNRGN